ncbi:MAG: 2-hydroxyacyl-CoA dehydratase [Thermoplasmata archaeon]|nr:MAG: 2-hydroxyacyl-CoA dehydratase [Thermoplasmata archaeon]
MNTVGITALVPPELIFACRMSPCDINNSVPKAGLRPASKLCAWTAVWRDMILARQLEIDRLVVVAGGDCHNALVDGQKVEYSGVPTHYFFYPFEEDYSFLCEQLEKLSSFLGGIEDPSMFDAVARLKERTLDIDRKRKEGDISAINAFEIMVAASDMKGDLNKFEDMVDNVKEEPVEYKARIALLGVPPIHYDFHKILKSLGLHVVYDELPYEFTRLTGRNMDELAKNYLNYTFARKLSFRLDFLEKELKRRNVDGVIHYTQFACHHLLEDDMMRKRLDYPWLVIQGDMPHRTPSQVKTRLEAFAEMLQKW